MIIRLRYAKSVRQLLVIAMLIVAFEFSYPSAILAQEFYDSNTLGPVDMVLKNDNLTPQVDVGQLPAIENKTPRLVRWVTVTAYSSTPDQCDDTPLITANGKWVYDGLVAANFLAFGTKIKLPDYFGDKIFTVDDRMHAKFQSRVDVWMPTRELAQAFGVRYLKVEVY